MLLGLGHRAQDGDVDAAHGQLRAGDVNGKPLIKHAERRLAHQARDHEVGDETARSQYRERSVVEE
jgi:hypothetical protein